MSTRPNHQQQREIVERLQHGEGLYLYRNNTGGELNLPKATKSGVRSVGAGKEFQGDNYFMQLVRQGLLRLVKEIQPPQPVEKPTTVQESTQILTEAKMNEIEEKLILDQPDIITEDGKIEHVVVNPKSGKTATVLSDQKSVKGQKVNENNSKKTPQPKNVLINESPVEGGYMIIG